MQYTAAILALSAALTSASVLPRDTATWSITDFHGESAENGAMYYSLTLTTGADVVNCAANNFVADGDCGSAGTPAPFANTSCDVANWSWSLATANTPTNPPQSGFSLKIAYSPDDEAPTYGCRLLPTTISCDTTANDEKMTIWDVPANFTETPSTSDCVYA